MLPRLPVPRRPCFVPSTEPRISLRPFGLGELIDRSINFWRTHWKALFSLILGFQLASAVPFLVQEALTRMLFPLAHTPASFQSNPMQALPQLGGSFLFLTMAMILMLLVSQVGGVALSHFAWQRVTGRGAPTPGDAFRHAAARLGTTIGAFALSVAWSVVVMLLLFLPSGVLAGITVYATATDRPGLATASLVVATILLIIASIVLMLWFVIRFVLLSQIIAIEPVGALEAFRRSNALSSGRVDSGLFGLVKIRLTILVTIVSGVLIVLGLVTSMPMLIVSAAYGSAFNPGQMFTSSLPMPVMVPLQLLEAALGSIVAPVYVVFQVFFYADMRVRREGLDLELAMQSA